MMMRVLVLGANGMLGHEMVRILLKNAALNVFGSVKENMSLANYPNQNASIISGIDACKINDVRNLVVKIRPDIVINCIADTRTNPDANTLKTYIYLNSIFPRQLSIICNENAAKLIHISTDAVHSGEKKCYTETDMPDPVCIYGLSKFASELIATSAIVVRASFIGFDCKKKRGLLEWALNQTGVIDGYKYDVFSGLSSIELSRAILKCFIEKSTMRSDIYNISGKPISKFDLLCLIKKTFKLNLSIKECYGISRTRILDPKKIFIETGYVAPDWTEMMSELKDSLDLYSDFVQNKAKAFDM